LRNAVLEGKTMNGYYYGAHRTLCESGYVVSVTSGASALYRSLAVGP